MKWLDVFASVCRKIHSVRGEQRDLPHRLNLWNNAIVNRIKEIALFTVIAMCEQIKQNIRELQLSDRHSFHVLGLDIMFDNQGNPQLLEVNDRPSKIRRPEYNHEIEMTAMVSDDLRIIFNQPREEPTTWEELYPRLPAFLGRMAPMLARLTALHVFDDPSSGETCKVEVVPAGQTVKGPFNLVCHTRFRIRRIDFKARPGTRACLSVNAQPPRTVVSPGRSLNILCKRDDWLEVSVTFSNSEIPVSGLTLRVCGKVSD
jgi:hypothetical protein